MWGIFRMIHKTNRKCFSRTVICTFTNQYKSCVHLSVKCHGPNVTDTSKGSIQIYYGNLAPQIRAVKIFSLLSSVTGLVSQPVLIQQVPNLGTPIAVAMFGFVGFFTFITPVLLHMITKKYVTHMYFDSGTGNYSAICLNFFLRQKKITFTTDDVVVPEVPGMFTSFHIKGIPLFVDPRLFDDPEHYAKIMGYDKPIDFKLHDISAEKTKPTEKTDSP